MKLLFLILLAVIIMSCGKASAEEEDSREAAETSSGFNTLLTVQITGFEEVTGFARMEIFNSEDGFPRDTNRSVYSASEPVNSDPVTFTIESLQPGIYAITVYHDEDGDGELDMSFYGPPSEKVGTSNDARGRMGPPSFEDACFTLASEPFEMIITL